MVKKIFFSLYTALFLVGVAASITGCNTIEGAGKDIQHGGREISEEARERK